MAKGKKSVWCSISRAPPQASLSSVLSCAVSAGMAAAAGREPVRILLSPQHESGTGRRAWQVAGTDGAQTSAAARPGTSAAPSRTVTDGGATEPRRSASPRPTGGPPGSLNASRRTSVGGDASFERFDKLSASEARLQAARDRRNAQLSARSSSTGRGGGHAPGGGHTFGSALAGAGTASAAPAPATMQSLGLGGLARSRSTPRAQSPGQQPQRGGSGGTQRQPPPTQRPLSPRTGTPRGASPRGASPRRPVSAAAAQQQQQQQQTPAQRPPPPSAGGSPATPGHARHAAGVPPLGASASHGGLPSRQAQPRIVGGVNGRSVGGSVHGGARAGGVGGAGATSHDAAHHGWHPHPSDSGGGQAGQPPTPASSATASALIGGGGFGTPRQAGAEGERGGGGGTERGGGGGTERGGGGGGTERGGGGGRALRAPPSTVVAAVAGRRARRIARRPTSIGAARRRHA